jgi:hypothetical protein
LQATQKSADEAEINKLQELCAEQQKIKSKIEE